MPSDSKVIIRPMEAPGFVAVHGCFGTQRP